MILTFTAIIKQRKKLKGFFSIVSYGLIFTQQEKMRTAIQL